MYYRCGYNGMVIVVVVVVVLCWLLLCYCGVE